MKKVLFISLLFILVSFRSFAAWENYEVWNVHAFNQNGEGQVENHTLYANINSYCDYVLLSGYLNNVQERGYVDMGVYINNTAYFSDYYDSFTTFSKRLDDPNDTPKYWSSITISSEAYNADAQILLRWGGY
jgi:hypothetical protein